MSGRCVEFREMSPGGMEMGTSGGERRKCQSDINQRSILDFCDMSALNHVNEQALFPWTVSVNI